MNKSITNFPLLYSMDKDSFYKTIDDYIYEKTYKKNMIRILLNKIKSVELIHITINILIKIIIILINI